MSQQDHTTIDSTEVPTVPGVFAVNKPLGISSAHAVAIVKRWARRTMGERNIKVGHGGTLDPLATGVLVIAVGRAYTRTIERYVGAQKEYIVRIHLGYTSTTDDAEGQKTRVRGPVPAFADIVDVCERFSGEIVQVPPIFSAIKKNGVPAYKRARAGEVVAMAPRTVRIDTIEVLSYVYPDFVLRVHCGKGTYMRSLARDIGEALGSAAYMSALERTRVGTFTREQAYDCAVFSN